MGEVRELNDQNFEQTLKDWEWAFVDVHASWCGPCRLFEPKFKEVAKENNDYGFFKIDGDDNPGVKERMDIAGLPYVAAFNRGRFVGGVTTATKEGLMEFIQSCEG